MSEIISGARKLSSEMLNERVARAASGFIDIGIRRGDLIAVYLRNDLAFIEASMAAARVGAYSTPVNWHYAPDEARYLFADSGARAIVIHADLIGSIRSALPSDVPIFVVETPPEIAAAYGLAPDDCRIPRGMTDWSRWLERYPPYQGALIPSPGSVIYTSGTTGHPKGVRRAPPTPAQFEAQDRALSLGFGLDGRQPIVAGVTGPMYHSAPNAYGMIAVRLGAKVILQPRFDAEELLALTEVHRITHLHMVPIMFKRLLKLPENVRHKYDLSSLRFVVHGAAPCPVPIKRAMIDWWGPIIHEYYGATETGIVVICDSQQWLAHPGTVGRAIPDARVQIIDAGGRSLPAGEIGEIVVRNPEVSDFTYHGDDAKRRAAEKAGLIAPGDVGYLDADGFLYLCDRAKDMIISGGANIYPAEIESELHRMPGVADCCVFGIPDDEFGESVCAAIQRQPDSCISEQDVRAYLREHMASYKVPKKVDFHADLPREDSGKIFKRKLREVYWAGLDRRI